MGFRLAWVGRVRMGTEKGARVHSESTVKGRERMEAAVKVWHTTVKRYGCAKEKKESNSW